MILTYNDLVALVDSGGLLDVERGNINAASIDLRLADTFYVEDKTRSRVIDLAEKEQLGTVPASRRENGDVILFPGEVALASSIETFNLPNDVAGLFVLKSTPARAFLTHMHSGWIDPGFHGSPMTMQLKNCLQASCLKLRAGMRIGQVIFWKGEDVPIAASYAVKGNYNLKPGVAHGH